MRRLLRILLKALNWTAPSLSTLLLIATAWLWVRSVGHNDGWDIYRFEPRPDWPDWTGPYLEAKGIWRWWNVRAVHGRLWLGWGSRAPAPVSAPRTLYTRGEISAEQANGFFDFVFRQDGSQLRRSNIERRWCFAGVGCLHWCTASEPSIGRPFDQAVQLAIPFWLLAAVFGLWPLLFAARRLLRRRRYGAGLCPQCGYDLRATPDRCPECGGEVAGKGP